MSNDKKFKGTPGPWMFHERPQGEYHYGYTIGDGPTSIVSTAWGEANARLIAAAPELLEALETFIEYWSDEEGCSSPHYQDVHKARAAIAKALGQ